MSTRGEGEGDLNSPGSRSGQMCDRKSWSALRKAFATSIA